MDKILIATGNKGKIAEFKRLLGDRFEIVGLPYGGYSGDVEENGTTFHENALIKAKDAFLHTGLPSLADDSGLCVSALDGRPGVFSARYLGNVPQHEKNMSLIAELDGKTDRNAKFVCELVLYSGGGEVAHAVGEVKGEILFEEHGTGGFGYDSIFFCTELKKSFGEATEDEKNAVSHRGRACEKMAALLKNP